MKRLLLPVVTLWAFLMVTCSVLGAYDIEIYAIKQDDMTLMIRRELAGLLNRDSRFHVTEEIANMEVKEWVLGNSTYMINPWDVEKFPLIVTIDTNIQDDTNQLLVAGSMFMNGVIIDSFIYSDSISAANQIVVMISDTIKDKDRLLNHIEITSIKESAITALSTIRKVYSIYLQTYGNLAGFSIGKAINEARIGKKATENWKFSIIEKDNNTMPYKYVATSTNFSPFGAGKKIWYDVQSASFHGYLIDKEVNP